MDTSETYIKMCSKATEIQTLRLQLHSYGTKDYWAYLSETPINSPLLGKRKIIIWIPRQDQLQEMIMPSLGSDFKGFAPFILNERLYTSLSVDGIYNWGRSFEQLWLAFIMKELYSKVWNEEEWVNA